MISNECHKHERQVNQSHASGSDNFNGAEEVQTSGVFMASQNVIYTCLRVTDCHTLLLLSFTAAASTCGTRHLFAASTSNTIRPTTQLTWSAAQTVCRQNQGSLVPSPALESGDYRQLPYFRCIESLLTSFFPFTSSSLHVWTPTCSSTQSCGIILIDQFQPANNEYRPDWDTSNAQFAYLALCLRGKLSLNRIIAL